MITNFGIPNIPWLASCPCTASVTVIPSVVARREFAFLAIVIVSRELDPCFHLIRVKVRS